MPRRLARAQARRGAQSKCQAIRAEYQRAETFFLPPLKMFLAFFDKNKKKKGAEKQEDSDEKKVEKLIEKLSEKEE